MGLRTFLPEVDSTSREARRRLAAGHDPAIPFVVWTTRQTSGHGQRGRTWVAPPGNLSASWWLPDRAKDPWTTHRAGLCVLDAAGSLGIDLAACGLKWVNDLVHVPQTGPARKWGGVLAESPGHGGIILGIGLNLVPSTLPEATWIGAFSAPVPPADAWVDALDEALGTPVDAATIRQRYASTCLSIGRPGTWLRPDGSSLSGTIEGLTEDGGLLLRSVDGLTHAVRSGQVRGPDGSYL